MKDLSKNYLQTPKKEGFTSFSRYDKTPSGDKLNTPISDKKINSVMLNLEGQAIFKSPFASNMNGQHIPAAYMMQYSQVSPGYQTIENTSVHPPQSSHNMLDGGDNLMENSFSPLKREEKNQNQAPIHTLSSYPYRFQLFSNAESPFQDKNNPNIAHYEPQNICYQIPDHHILHDYENIERDIIYNNQNSLSKLACETIADTIKTNEDSDIQGSSIVLKKPKFVIEFADNSELQDFQNSDEFKIIQKKLDYSNCNYILDIPVKGNNGNNKSSNHGKQSLFPQNLPIAHKKMNQSSRIGHSQSQQSSQGSMSQHSRYVSASPQSHHHQYSHRQFMFPQMSKRNVNPQYFMHPSPYFYYNEYAMPPPPHPSSVHPLPVHLQSPKFNSNTHSHLTNPPTQSKDLNVNSKFTQQNENKTSTQKHSEKKVGKILFNSSNRKLNNNMESSENSKQKTYNKDKENTENSSMDTEEHNEKLAKQVLRGEDIMTEDAEVGDNNTLGIPLNDEQKQILKEKLKSIHNKPDSTFLEQQIEIIEKKAAEKISKSKSKKNKAKEEASIQSSSNKAESKESQSNKQESSNKKEENSINKAESQSNKQESQNSKLEVQNNKQESQSGKQEQQSNKKENQSSNKANNQNNKIKEESSSSKQEDHKKKEEIEEVEVKQPVVSASKKSTLKQESELQPEQEKHESNIKTSLSTAKKARSSSKTEFNNQDSINKKRRHYDTPNHKRNEYSTPSTKKKYDQHSFNKQQVNQTSSDISTKTIPAGEKKLKKSATDSNNPLNSQQEEKLKTTVSDFSNEVHTSKDQVKCKSDKEQCNHNHHHHDHNHNESKDDDEDRAMMAEEENLSGIDQDNSSDEEEDEDDDNLDGSDKKECCGCKKTKCLKLYCECFQAMRYCVGHNCQGCLNKPEFDDLRKSAMDSIQQRNSSAFEPKADKSEEVFESASGQKIHSKGCNCKKSDCRKKYCECFQMGAKCTNLCKCFNCKNRSDSSRDGSGASGQHQFSGSKQGMNLHPHHAHPLFFMDGTQVPHHLSSPHLPPHHLGVPPPMQFRGAKQHPMYFYGAHPSLHPSHKAQGYAYEQWNPYYNHQDYPEYSYPRKGADISGYAPGSQSQQLSEYDHTPRFNSVKRQQVQIIQKSAYPVKDFNSEKD